MKLERLMLLIAGLAGIGAAFLPFLNLELKVLGESLGSAQLSGYSYVTAWLQQLGLVEGQNDAGKGLIELFQSLWDQSHGIKGYVQLAGLAIISTGPIFYALYSLGYIYRAIAGKSFKRGIWFNLLFMALGFGVFFWISQDFSTEILGQEVGLKLNFFKMAGIGYWINFVAVFVAGFSLIFAKDLK